MSSAEQKFLFWWSPIYDSFLARIVLLESSQQFLIFFLVLLRLWTAFGCGFQAAAVQGLRSCPTSCSVPLWLPPGHCSHQLEPLYREEHWPTTDAIPQKPVSLERSHWSSLSVLLGWARYFLQCTFYIAVFTCFWLRWVFIAAWGLSLVVVREGCSLLRSSDSKCVGFGSFGTWA